MVTMLWGILLTFIHFFILRKLIRNKSKRCILSLLIFILPFLIVTSLKLVKGFVPLPNKLRSTYNLLLYDSHPDMHEPINTDVFLFSEEGYTQTYHLKPKYLGTYCIGIYSQERALPVEGNDFNSLFEGELKAEFYLRDKFIFEKIFDGTDISYMTEFVRPDDEFHYLHTGFMILFDIPLDSKYIDDISVRLTVIKPFEKLAKFESEITLFIGMYPWSRTLFGL